MVVHVDPDLVEHVVGRVLEEAGAIRDGATPSEGHDYYMTGRAGAVNYPNYTHLAPALMLEAPMLADATTYAPYIFTPYLGIVGSKAMDPSFGALTTGPLTKTFFDLASEPKRFVQIEGASHVDLHDRAAHVNRAVEAMDFFFQEHAG